MTTSQEIHVEATIEAEAETEVIPKILAMVATNARVEFARALVIRIVIYMSHAAWRSKSAMIEHVKAAAREPSQFISAICLSVLTESSLKKLSENLARSCMLVFLSMREDCHVGSVWSNTPPRRLLTTLPKLWTKRPSTREKLLSNANIVTEESAKVSKTTLNDSEVINGLLLHELISKRWIEKKLKYSNWLLVCPFKN